MIEQTADFPNVRFGWLKFMYIYTIMGAGGLGLGILFAPKLVQSAFDFPAQDPVVFGIVGSVYAAFGLLSIFGLRRPLAFAPVLLLQLWYKIFWSVVIAAPLIFSGRLPVHATILLLVFATYIVGDLAAIPFSHIFSKRSGVAKAPPSMASSRSGN